MEVKMALCHLVKNFSIEVCAKTPIPVVMDFTNSLAPKGGMWLQFKSRCS